VPNRVARFALLADRLDEVTEFAQQIPVKH
jgi:hypothetical protein